MALTEKAFLEIEGGAATIPCMFNPAEFSVSRSNSWTGESLAGHGVPQVVYRGAQSGSMSLNLMFDTTDTGQAVTTHTGKLLKLMDVDPALPGSDPQSNNVRPPYVVFHWGSMHSFKAVVSSLNLQFTYFSSTGVPLRAQVALDLDPVRRVRRLRAAEPHLGDAEPAPGPPGAAGGDAGPDRRQVLRRFDPVATDRCCQRHRRPAGAAHRLVAQRAQDQFMTAALTVNSLAPIVKVAGVELPAATLDSVRGMRIHRGLRIPARCILDLTDVGFAESAGSRLVLGNALEVSRSIGHGAVRRRDHRRAPGAGWRRADDLGGGA